MTTSALWPRVDALVARADGIDALRLHRLHLYAAGTWLAAGRRLPADLMTDVHLAGAMALAAPTVLQHVRDAWDGELLLMKGPEVAARYRSPSDRGYRDLDLLAADPEAAQRALLAAGFIELHDPTAPQHLAPLMWPSLPLIVELHRYPHLPGWLPPVAVDELFASSVPSATGIAGLRAPDPARHALLLAAHSWAHQPLARLGDLVDIAVFSAAADPAECDARARVWGWRRFWRLTERMVNAVLLDGPAAPGWTRPWSRHLVQARDRTVLEHHVARLAAPACAPLAHAPHALLEQVRRTTRPRPDERWPDKLSRSRRAVAHAFMAKSGHEQTVGTGRVEGSPFSRAGD